MILDAHLGEQSCPYGLDFFDLCGLDDGLELVGLVKLASHLPQLPQRRAYSDVDAVIGEDEGGVGGCELGSRHCDRRS